MRRNGSAELEAIIAKIRAIGGLAKRAAPDVADAIKAELERTIAAAESPEGKRWEPRKEGGAPLATAARSLAVVPLGTRIYARLGGHVARHHLGRARGGIERRILPSEGVPPGMVRAIKRALVEHFNGIVRGA